jgi:hypothetical protein
MKVNVREKPQIWMWAARDLLQGAMKQSRHGVPEYVARAVDAWSVGSTASLDQKNSMIHGIETYLEDMLAVSLREMRGPVVSTMRSISPPPPAVVPATVSANTNGVSLGYAGAPFDVPRDGGIPILQAMLDQIDISGSSDPETVRAQMDRIPYPIAFAKLIGDEGLGTLLDSNQALNTHFGWKRVPLASQDRVTGVRGMTIKRVLHPNNFAIARILLLRPGGTFKPSKMKFLKGEHRNVNPDQRMDDDLYVACMGAGVVSFLGAFGIFTGLADSVGSPRSPK